MGQPLGHCLDVSDVVLVSLLSTLNIFATFLWHISYLSVPIVDFDQAVVWMAVKVWTDIKA